MPSRRRHTFRDHDRDELLRALGACRDAVIRAGTAAVHDPELTAHLHTFRGAIDDLAGVLTGDRQYFWLKLATARR